MSDIIPQEDIPQKRCYKCKELKPCTSEHFGPDKRSTDGFRNCCKPCRRIEYKEALERNPNMEKERYEKRYGSLEEIEQRREYHAAYMRKFRKIKQSEGMCGQCGVRLAEIGTYCTPCKEYMRAKKEDYRHKWPEYGKTERDKVRQEVLEAYGGKCQCCGETQPEFLAIDHINNDGAEHRRAIGGNLYRWLRKNNFPPEFQILCHNCNYAKFRYIVCPHQRKTF